MLALIIAAMSYSNCRCCIGIDSDIKLWAPTAEEPREPGRQAERVMAENRQQQVLEDPIRWYADTRVSMQVQQRSGAVLRGNAVHLLCPTIPNEVLGCRSSCRQQTITVMSCRLSALKMVEHADGALIVQLVSTGARLQGAHRRPARQIVLTPQMLAQLLHLQHTTGFGDRRRVLLLHFRLP